MYDDEFLKQEGADSDAAHSKKNDHGFNDCLGVKYTGVSVNPGPRESTVPRMKAL